MLATRLGKIDMAHQASNIKNSTEIHNIFINVKVTTSSTIQDSYSLLSG